jgi:hypothetical protein
MRPKLEIVACLGKLRVSFVAMTEPPKTYDDERCQAAGKRVLEQFRKKLRHDVAAINAIHEKCRECCGSAVVEKCPNEDCPLYPFRLGA